MFPYFSPCLTSFPIFSQLFTIFHNVSPIFHYFSPFFTFFPYFSMVNPPLDHRQMPVPPRPWAPWCGSRRPATRRSRRCGRGSGGPLIRWRRASVGSVGWEPGWWWLEPWNFMTFHLLGISWSLKWRTHIFQGGWKHQLGIGEELTGAKRREWENDS